MPKDMVQVRGGARKSFAAPDVRIGRSQFNRSHGLKTTFDASRLIPILLDEVLPGDTFTCKLNGFVRIFSPLDAPVMDNIELETLFFFVPNRLLWDNWENFQGAHDEAGAQDTDYTIPIMADGMTVDHDGGTAALDMAAYFGLPDGLSSTAVEISALPFRAYNLIMANWFRDQNVTDEVALSTDNGPQLTSSFVLRRSGKKHDYFTSALPYLQKGSAGTVALTGLVDVRTAATAGEDLSIYSTALLDYQLLDAGAPQVDISVSTDADGSEKAFVDLSTTGLLDINTLRQSVAIQRLLETDARGGTRYVEILKAHFGVTSPDFRLQRSEYLGGGKSMINVSPVANTSATATEDQGELRGIGTGVISGHSWSKSFVEHGYILGLVRARGDITYFQGVDKLWSRSTRYDFFMPALANLGEQAILNQELFVSNDSNDALVFGYQARWEEYRVKRSLITGILNPNAASNLGFWHLAEDFASLPTLNETFIIDQTPMDRVKTVDTGPDFLMDLWFDYKCARPIPIYSVPSLMSQRF